jgi:hypothetical protein
MSAPPPATPAPSTVTAAFWLYLAGAALGVVSATVAAVIGIHRINAGAVPGADVSPGVIDAVRAVGVAFDIVLGVAGIVGYVVFAVLMRRGAGWARIVLTVLSTIAFVSGLVGLFVLNLLNLLVSALVTAAAVLIWQRSANAWFAARRPPMP